MRQRRRSFVAGNLQASSIFQGRGNCGLVFIHQFAQHRLLSFAAFLAIALALNHTRKSGNMNHGVIPGRDARVRLAYQPGET